MFRHLNLQTVAFSYFLGLDANIDDLRTATKIQNTTYCTANFCAERYLYFELTKILLSAHRDQYKLQLLNIRFSIAITKTYPAVK